MRVAYVVIGFALAIASAFQAAPSWATSWDAYAKAIAPFIADPNDSGFQMLQTFDGKPVVWEGTVAKDAKYVDEPYATFVIEVTPQTFKYADAKPAGTVQVTILKVEPKEGSLAAWKRVPPGTKVRFRAVLKAPLYAFVTMDDKTEGFFYASEAEPILGGR